MALPGIAAAIEPAGPVAGLPSAEVMARQLRERYPSTRIDRVSPALIPGMYEVVMGRNVAYVDSSGRYFVFGHVWDMQERRDTTADRLGSIDTADVSALPAAHALTWVRGSGRNLLNVFADPMCGHCRTLERALEKLDDVTVRLYILPILGPESRRIAEAVWCSPNRETAWREWMLRGAEPTVAQQGCKAEGLASIEKAARSMGIQGTPMLYSGDGRKRAGALTSAEITTWLNAAQIATTTAAAAGNATTKTAPATEQPTKDKASQ
jgi:thiol:disulfide interchange protein DsbC